MLASRSRRVWLAGSVLSLHDDLQCFHVEHCLGQQLLQPAILGLQVLQPSGLRNPHAAELRAPRVERRITETVLPAQFPTSSRSTASFETNA